MLQELWLSSGSPFQTVSATEEKRCATILVCDIGTVSKSISADLIHGMARMALMWRADSLVD